MRYRTPFTGTSDGSRPSQRTFRSRLRPTGCDAEGSAARRSVFLMAAVLSGVQLAPSLGWADLPNYVITDLGAVGGSSSAAFGINELGQVTGISMNRSFLWTPAVPNGTTGSLQNLGVLPGGFYSNGLGVNAKGQVIGESYIRAEPYNYRRAFLWSPMTPNGSSGTMQDLGTLGGTSSSGYSVNDSGKTVGWSNTTGDLRTHAFLYDGTMQDLGTLGGLTSWAYSINNSGQVVGWSNTTISGTEYDLEHAFLYDGTMHDLGTLGGTHSNAYSINDSGQVVGSSSVTGSSSYHAFLWTPTMPNASSGMMQDLGTLGGSGSTAYDINSSGHVTGESPGVGEFLESYAFVYTTETGIVDLNSLIDPLSGWILNGGYAINDIGQIAGTGTIGGETHAFLLTPVTVSGDFDGDNDVDGHDFLTWQRGESPDPLSALDLAAWRSNFGSGNSLVTTAAVVPEPSTRGLFILGVMAFVVRRRP